MIKGRKWLLTGAAIALLGACIGVDELTGPDCTPVQLSVTGTSGDTVTLNTGLRYRETSAGLGVTADWCDITTVHYDAFLTNGTRFDTSRDDFTAFVFTPGLGQLIDGFEQGVVGMRRGGKRRLIIPPSLGFGAEERRDPSGTVVVPANSTLIYDIELLDVIDR